MIVENSLNEKIKHEETCTMYHNSTEVDYFTKETFTRLAKWAHDIAEALADARIQHPNKSIHHFCRKCSSNVSPSNDA